MKEIDEFITLIVKLQPVEFMGLARVLKVKLYKDEENHEPREFNEILEEVLERLSKTNRKRRREIMQLLRAATRGVDSASNT